VTRIVIFAKAPQPGFAKTRLIPALGADGAAQLARDMLAHTVQAALAADIGPVELCATPAIHEPAWQDVSLPADVRVSTQCSGDLGIRLAEAAQRALGRGEAVLLLGTDCVEMDAELLRAAAQELQQHDAVIHGTSDGGYALLGLKRFSPFLFDDIPWSTDEVASATLDRLGQLGWSVYVGQMLHDVDEPQDLPYLNSRRGDDAAKTM